MPRLAALAAEQTSRVSRVGVLFVCQTNFRHLTPMGLANTLCTGGSQRRKGHMARGDPAPPGFIPPVELNSEDLMVVKENFRLFDKDGDGPQTPFEAESHTDGCVLICKGQSPATS